MHDTRIINASELANQLDEPQLRIIDVRPYENYQESHIAGAVHFDSSRLNRRNGDTVGLLPSETEFTADMQSLGINTDSHVVVYDDTAEPVSGRFAWTLLAYGHNAVAILDGGWQQWQHLQLPTTNKIAEHAHGNFSATLQENRVADFDYIAQHLQALQIIDTRSAAEYHGEDIRSAKGGHIPGAININWTELKAADSLFKSPEQLHELLSQHDIDSDREIVCYCQSHQRSSLMCIALEHLGYSKVRGYPGAWSDWGNRQDSPIE